MNQTTVSRSKHILFHPETKKGHQTRRPLKKSSLTLNISRHCKSNCGIQSILELSKSGIFCWVYILKKKKHGNQYHCYDFIRNHRIVGRAFAPSFVSNPRCGVAASRAWRNAGLHGKMEQGLRAHMGKTQEKTCKESQKKNRFWEVHRLTPKFLWSHIPLNMVFVGAPNDVLTPQK